MPQERFQFMPFFAQINSVNHPGEMSGNHCFPTTILNRKKTLWSKNERYNFARILGSCRFTSQTGRYISCIIKEVQWRMAKSWSINSKRFFPSVLIYLFIWFLASRVPFLESYSIFLSICLTISQQSAESHLKQELLQRASLSLKTLKWRLHIEHCYLQISPVSYTKSKNGHDSLLA